MEGQLLNEAEFLKLYKCTAVLYDVCLAITGTLDWLWFHKTYKRTTFFTRFLPKIQVDTIGTKTGELQKRESRCQTTVELQESWTTGRIVWKKVAKKPKFARVGKLGKLQKKSLTETYITSKTLELSKKLAGGHACHWVWPGETCGREPSLDASLLGPFRWSPLLPAC